MLAVVAERDLAEAVVGPGPDRRDNSHRAELLEDLRMEIADREAVFEREAAALPVARAQLEAVRNEVELDLEAARAAGDRMRGQAARRYVQRYMPPVVDRRAQCKADLADDLEIEVQRVARLPPCFERQRRPVIVCGVLLRDSGPDRVDRDRLGFAPQGHRAE